MAICGVCGEKFNCEHMGSHPEKGNFFVHHIPSEDPNIIETQHITYYQILRDGKGTFVQGNSETFVGYIEHPCIQTSFSDFTETKSILV
jgi:hypothetical protein